MSDSPLDPVKLLEALKTIDLNDVHVIDEVLMSSATLGYVQRHFGPAEVPSIEGIRVMFDQMVPLGYGDMYARGRLVGRIKVLSYADELQTLMRNVERQMWMRLFGPM